ncbi:MAG TPA: Ig-like domain-containing protein [Mycobacteriales bacterium]|nr:Ig-like domain-containing protein [Mycobacteriales bacterium]
MLDPGDRVVGGRLESAAPTLVRLHLPSAHVSDGQAVALEARVVTVHDVGPTPTGTVAFRAGHRLLGTAPLDADGRAVLDGVRLPVGVHPVVASYGGDADHAAATSAPVPQAIVAPAVPVVVALAVPERTADGVVLRAQILDAAVGRSVEDVQGAVTFALDGDVLGSAELDDGQATLVLPDLPVGRITARFRGDLEHAAAEGAAEGLSP